MNFAQIKVVSGPSGFPTNRPGDSSFAVFFVCASVLSYVAFVLSLFVPNTFFSLCLGILCFVIVAFSRYLH